MLGCASQPLSLMHAIFGRHLDTSQGGHKDAFAKLKGAMQTPLTQLRSTETREAIVVPEGETLTLYADHCKAFTKDDQLEIANVPCKVIHIAEHFVQVKPHSTADWPAEATIHQHQAHTTPEVPGFRCLLDAVLDKGARPATK